MIRQTYLTHRTTAGTLLRSKATLEYSEGRIYFLNSPFALKDEIKAMKGSKWHGHDEDDGRKIWSVEDCQRNRFQLSFLEGEDAFAWFDRDIIRHEYEVFKEGKPEEFMPHQADLADSALTYHYQIWAAEMGVGKTLAAQKVIEMSGVRKWFWIGPKSSLPNIRREFRIWGFDFSAVEIEFITYEALVRLIEDWSDEAPPQGVIFDESSRLKGASSQRTSAGQVLADMIRENYGYDGYVIEMSGTPSPKSPVDWWSQTEIAWPGFLREGTPRALEQRLAFLDDMQTATGVAIKKRVGWRDDERKCNICGDLFDDGPHDRLHCEDPDEFHKFVPSKNEVSYLYERLKGLVVIKHKKDCLTLPDKRYRRIICKPSESLLRVAKAIVDTADNTMIGATLLRELSDGFQYREVADGKSKCPHCPQHCGKVDEWFDPTDEDRTYSVVDFLDPDRVAQLEKRTVDCPRCGGDGEVTKYVREAKEIPCPKDKALRALLGECEETGRIVIFAGFTGSVDRVVKLCQKEMWDVVRCDGRGFHIETRDGEVITDEEALDYWSNMDHARVAFVAHPESGGMSLTLVEARMAVYWSNSFKPEYRSQSEDRIHRKGMDLNLGCEIVDLLHLPSDTRVLEVIRANRKLELMTLGELAESLETLDTGEEQTVEELMAAA